MQPINAKMTKNKYILLLLTIFLMITMVACKTQKVSQSIQSDPIDIHLPDTSALPTFPAEVIYVLGAQWENNSNLQQESTIAEYIEKELIRLYPEKAYKGYIRNLCTKVDTLLKDSYQTPTLFIPKRNEINLTSSRTKSFDLYRKLDSLSLEEELKLLALTPEEYQEWDILQKLVHSETILTRESFDTLKTTTFENENLLTTLMIWKGPRMFYRVIQSKSRAERVAYYYYGEATNFGKPGDAFKHIYVNVLLRTYVGEWMSHAIMDVFWEWNSPNAPCDFHMDKHNNMIGRLILYKQFTGSSDQYLENYWLQWAENVYRYIQDKKNANLQMWNLSTPADVVEPAAKKVRSSQYIYWNK